MVRPFVGAIASCQGRQQGRSPAAYPQGATLIGGQATGAAAARGLPVRADACQRPGRRGNACDQPAEGRRPQRRRLQAWRPPSASNNAYRKGSRLCTRRTTCSPVALVGATTTVST
ncbi:hypothetical protein BHE74_00052364 [Ensete ventricosum]|nr:hypothetical protein BHE74_00052364 [Ensete ventricosum]